MLGVTRKLDALMAEYNPRPSRSRREHTLGKLRKALPWPGSAPGVATGRAMGGEGGGTCDGAYLDEEVDFDGAGEVEEGRGGGRLGGDSNEDGFDAEDVSDGDRQAIPEGGRRGNGNQLSPRGSGEDDGAGAGADGPGRGGGPAEAYRVSDGSHGICGGGLGSTHGDANDGAGAAETTGSGVVAPDDGGDKEEVHSGSPPTPGASPIEDGTDKYDGNPSVRGAAVSNRPATGQRKVRWEDNTADEHFVRHRGRKHTCNGKLLYEEPRSLDCVSHANLSSHPRAGGHAFPTARQGLSCCAWPAEVAPLAATRMTQCSNEGWGDGAGCW